MNNSMPVNAIVSTIQIREDVGLALARAAGALCRAIPFVATAEIDIVEYVSAYVAENDRLAKLYVDIGNSRMREALKCAPLRDSYQISAIAAYQDAIVHIDNMHRSLTLFARLEKEKNEAQ